MVRDGVRQLFGGAVRLAGIPTDWLDTDAFMDIARRPVPDNQEIIIEPLKRYPAMESEVGAEAGRAAAGANVVFVDLMEGSDDGQEKEEANIDMVVGGRHRVLDHLDDVALRMGLHVDARSITAEEGTVPAKIASAEAKATTSRVRVALSAERELAMMCTHIPRASVDIVLTFVLDAQGRTLVDADAVHAALEVADWGLFDAP